MIKIKRFLKKLLKKHFILFGVSIVYFFVGILALAFLSKLTYPFEINSSIAVFLLFLLLNIAIARTANLRSSLIRYWSLKKTYFFLLGFLGYLLILVVTQLITFFFVEHNKIYQPVSLNNVYSIAITFIIVGWEELLFRGIILNYLLKFSSRIYLSYLIGFFFMLIHTFNPEVDLLLAGPSLFFAGTLLTLLYFHYENIWLPLGVHFSNNLLSYKLYLITGYEIQTTNLFFVTGGYLDAIILAMIHLIFIYSYYKSRSSKLRL